MAYAHAYDHRNLTVPHPPGFPTRPVLFVPVFDPNFAYHMDMHHSLSLLQYMKDEKLVPSIEEDVKRKSIIEKLKTIALSWVTRVAWQRKFPENVIRDASARILTYGSYGLGVHNSESDIDALCVGPWFATMREDFFTVLYNILKNTPQVSEIYCVKDAKVPLLRFKFEGIAVDMPYAQLQVMSVPENVDLQNPVVLTSVDEISGKSLSGVRANQSILQLLPNVENFQSLLRCIKFWAKRRGVYGNLFGFFGGIHLAILSAFVCQRSQDAGLSVLVMNFFNTFASWPWPTPVTLHDRVMQTVKDMSDKRSWMPIVLPCSPYEYCQSNMTQSTFNRIRTEFLRGQRITKVLLRPDFTWGTLFEPYEYHKRYSRFLKIHLLICEKDDLADWVGWVKSRFRSLILKLEEIQGFCDPNPTEYVEAGNVEAEPNVVFYWGLHPCRSNDFNVTSLEKDFSYTLCIGYQGPRGKMAMSIVQASELPSCTQFPIGRVNGTRSCWRNPDYDQQRIPMYSMHLPQYFVGYMAGV